MTNRRNVVTLASLAALVAAGARAQPAQSLGTIAVATIRELRERRPTAASEVALVAGYYAAGDGGGGLFVWQADRTNKPDDGLIIGNADQRGRWLRAHDGPLNVRMFGARGDGKADDTAAIQRAIDAAAGAEVRIPAGIWRVTRTLRFHGAADRHAPALKLIGDGMEATILDCRIADGPAISVEQLRGYRFTRGGYIRDLEFYGGNAPAGRNQHGLVMSGAWLYRLQRVTVNSFRGHGVFVPFKANRGQGYSKVEVTAGSNIVRRPEGGFSSTVLPGEVVEGDGIPDGTVAESVIDDSTLRISKPVVKSGSVALNIYGQNPDGQSTLLFLEDARIVQSGQWGIYGDISVGFSLGIVDTEIGGNKAGGIRTNGWFYIRGGAVVENGTNDGKGVGILLDAATNSGVQRSHIEGVEFDSNKEANLWLRRARFVQVQRCRFIAKEWDTLGVQFPRAGVRFGDSDGSLVQTAEFVQNMVRVDARHLFPHVGFEIPDGAAVDNLVVRDTFFFGGWSDAHHTKYRIGKLANTNAQIRFDEEGRLAAGLPVPAQYCAQLLASGRWTIDPGASLILPFSTIQSNQPRMPANWAISERSGVTTAGSDELVFDAVVGQRLGPRHPVLLFKDRLSFEKGEIVQGARIMAMREGRQAKLDRSLTEPSVTIALLGGSVCPFEGYFAVDAIVDVLAAGHDQQIALSLVADGKPWRTENAVLHGIPVPETTRLSVVQKWAADTTLHVRLQNASPGPVSVVRASLTVRLVT